MLSACQPFPPSVAILCTVPGTSWLVLFRDVFLVAHCQLDSKDGKRQGT